jgi:hypothetical protein
MYNKCAELLQICTKLNNKNVSFSGTYHKSVNNFFHQNKRERQSQFNRQYIHY